MIKLQKPNLKVDNQKHQNSQQSFQSWFLNKSRKTLVWLIWDFSSLRFIYSKIRPEIKKYKRREPSTFVLWTLGIYFAAFGIASSRYENKRDNLEIRLSIVAPQLFTDGKKEAFKEIVNIQQAIIPKKPEIRKPFTIVLSLFGDNIDSDVLKQTVRLISNEKIKLNDLDLFKVNLEGADLRKADLSRTNLRQANLSRAFLKEANLSEADLRQANLTRTRLFKADLSKANLSGVDLTKTYIKEADFSGAYLYLSEFSNDKIKSVKNWEQAIYTKAEKVELYSNNFQWIPEDSKANQEIIEIIRNSN